MGESERLDLGKLAKEIVTNRLKDVEDAPTVAAEVVKKTIVAGVQATKARGEDPHLTVQDVVQGALLGLILIEKDVVAATTAILGRLSEAAQEVHIDPQEMLTWALEGVAKLTPLVERDVLYRIRVAADKQFMGVGEVFDKLCAKEKAKT
ncbi:MAG: hypothetical protein HY553_03175 [Elusimicrobia bacterium]|nr:hypothetical protein [Elusimicrobiota bacterium]